MLGCVTVTVTVTVWRCRDGLDLPVSALTQHIYAYNSSNAAKLQGYVCELMQYS
jgi:hypothetical protein